jgi:cytochrome bd ubiquinol oxidase subunit II
VADVWFVILVATLAAFAVLDGWNLGAGMLLRIVARTDTERRQVVAALGPLWSWHEVWLVAAGGVFMLAFPGVLASAFSGFYLPVWLLLWSLLVRGLALEVGAHLDDRLWRGFWDMALAAASTALAFLLGAVLGNLLRGVPLDANGAFRLPLFTDFRVGGDLGVFDWLTLVVALCVMVVLAAHGATYLQVKTAGAVHDRSARLARVLWIATPALLLLVIAAFAAGGLETMLGPPGPAVWLCAVVLGAAAWAIGSGLRGAHERRALAGSCAVIAALLAMAAAALHPVMLPSTLDPAWSLTVDGGATARSGLRTALVWWPISAGLAVAYAVVVARSFRGKV